MEFAPEDTDDLEESDPETSPDDELIALARQRLTVAGDTKDSVAQFVLLNMARELAAESA